MMRCLFLMIGFFWTCTQAAEETPGSTAAWGLPQLMQSLAQVSEVHAKFVESKFLSVLNAPLQSSGTLSYKAPKHLEKHTLMPRPEDMVLDQGVLSIDIPARHYKQNLVLQEYPAVWTFVESIRATLAGDLPALQRFYEINLEGNAERWHLHLQPTQQQTRKVVREIIIGGHGNRVTSIETLESNTDHTRMSVFEAEP